jgi:hypothetical protein
MTKLEKQRLVESLQKQLDVTNQMWKDGHGHAYIIGYLQGTVKQVIEELKC